MSEQFDIEHIDHPDALKQKYDFSNEMTVDIGSFYAQLQLY